MYEMKPLNNTIHCKDGFHISIQASRYHYCEPRIDHPKDGYTHVECGFPSLDPGDELRAYQEMPDEDPTGCVYPYVPVEVVNRLIDAHGGIKEGHMPLA